MEVLFVFVAVCFIFGMTYHRGYSAGKEDAFNGMVKARLRPKGNRNRFNQ